MRFALAAISAALLSCFVWACATEAPPIMTVDIQPQAGGLNEAPVCCYNCGCTHPGCAQGYCCDEPYTLCGGTVCRDLDSDILNCGACGNHCNALGNETCVDGRCACGSSSYPDACAGGCVNFDSDVFNCGGCGNACAAGENCQLGQCGAGCSYTYECPAETICVSDAYSIDIYNGYFYASAVFGACVALPCSADADCDVAPTDDVPNPTCCSGTCYDTRNDPLHCGTCNLTATGCTGDLWEACSDSELCVYSPLSLYACSGTYAQSAPAQHLHWRDSEEACP